MQAPASGTGVGVQILNAPNSPAQGDAGQAPGGTAQTDPNAVVKPVGPASTLLPAPEKPAEAPVQVNDIKPGENPAQPTNTAKGKPKKPKTDLSEDSSSKKKKKKGLAKLNPF